VKSSFTWLTSQIISNYNFKIDARRVVLTLLQVNIQTSSKEWSSKPTQSFLNKEAIKTLASSKWHRNAIVKEIFGFYFICASLFFIKHMFELTKHIHLSIHLYQTILESPCASLPCFLLSSVCVTSSPTLCIRQNKMDSKITFVWNQL